MTLAEQLTDYVHAACAGLWVQTAEPDEAEREIMQLAGEQKWRLAVWDVASGMRLVGSPQAAEPMGGGEPLAALRALPALADPQGTAVLVLHNFHRFLANAEVIQTVFAQLVTGKQQRTFIVVLAPMVQLPVELEKLFVILDHALPDRGQLGRIARELTTDSPEDLPSGEALERILDAAAGLTRYEAETAFALSLTRHNALLPDTIWELKTQGLRKSGLLTLHRGQESFADLGGLQAVKDFCLRALTSRRSRRVKPRGVLLLGVPGSGKTALTKALGHEAGRPTLILDMGALLGSLVGQSEANLRQALRIADAMSPAILLIDEAEKALSGVGSAGDSGVATRLFGSLLTWMSDRTSDVFVMMTSNDISRLPPEFTRAERLDGVFFLDLPGASEKDAIWALYRRQYDIPESQARPDDTSWTGAEIKSCCRLAALLDMTLTQAALQVVPVAVTAAETVEKLRTWASGRCLSATNPGIYHRDGARPTPTRKLRRGSSLN